MPYSLTLTGSLVEDMAFPRRFRPCPRAVAWRGGTTAVQPERRASSLRRTPIPPGIWSDEGTGPTKGALSRPSGRDGLSQPTLILGGLPLYPTVGTERRVASRSRSSFPSFASRREGETRDGLSGAGLRRPVQSVRFGPLALRGRTVPCTKNVPKQSQATDTAVVSCIDALLPALPFRLPSELNDGVSALYHNR